MTNAVAKPKLSLAQVLRGVRQRNTENVNNDEYNNTTRQQKHDKNAIDNQVQVTTVRQTVRKAPSSFKLANRVPTSANKQSKTAANKLEKEDIEIFHEKKLKYFADLQKSLPTKRLQLAKITDPHDRAKLQEEIRSIESRKEELDYFIMTFDIINEYMLSSTSGNIEEDGGNYKSNEQDLESITSDISWSLQNKSSTLNDILTKRDNTNQLYLSNEFYRKIEPSRVNVGCLYKQYQTCEECDGTLFMVNGSYSCANCGLESREAVGDLQWSYKDIQDISYKTNFSYKRLTRFKDLLNSIQAKENTDIPESVIEAVKSEIIKDQPRSLDDINMDRIKYYLKRTGNNKYYEHRAYIIDRIKGKPPVMLPPDTEEELVQMFILIQEPFEEVRKIVQPERTSFLSYQYVCYKFFELLGMYDKLKFFPLLKSREKLDVQDRIWKGICDRLGWEFFRST